MEPGPAETHDLWDAARRVGLAVQERAFERGEHVLDQGDEIPGLFLLRSGLARVHTTADNGQEILFGFVGEGEILGEIEYFSGEPVWCTVQAARRTTAWFLPLPSLHQLLEQEPRLGLALARTMARRYHRDFQRTSLRITHRLAHSVLRICLSLMERPGQPRLRKRDLADYLATSERHLNRVLKELEERGALETSPGEIRVVHAEVARKLMEQSG